MAALSVLVSIAGGPEAGLLGSGWVIVLRTLSHLATLQTELDRRAIDKLAAEVNALTRYFNEKLHVLTGRLRKR